MLLAVEASCGRVWRLHSPVIEDKQQMPRTGGQSLLMTAGGQGQQSPFHRMQPHRRHISQTIVVDKLFSLRNCYQNIRSYAAYSL